MILKCTAIFDSAVCAFTAPHFFRTIGEAERTFRDAVSREDSAFNLHAKDYTIFLLGDYDDQTASFSPLSTPQPIITAIQAKAMNTETNFSLTPQQDPPK